MAERIMGTIKWFPDRRNYGYITYLGDRNRTESIFVRLSAIEAALQTAGIRAQQVELHDARVIFEIARNKKNGKLQATNLKWIGQPNYTSAAEHARKKGPG